jgi:hypothetical protein
VSFFWDGFASVLRAEKAVFIDATPHGPGDLVLVMHLALLQRVQ